MRHPRRLIQVGTLCIFGLTGVATANPDSPESSEPRVTTPRGDLAPYEQANIERPTMGVDIVTAQAAAQVEVEGALVMRVRRGSGADRAGIRGTQRDRFGRVHLGDIIVAVAGQPIRSTDDFWLALDRKRAGEEVEVELVREGRRFEVSVVLGQPEGR